MRVVNVNTHAIGTIEYIKDGYIAIDFHGDISKYAYPSSFAKMFELEDEVLQEQIQTEGVGASFEMFKRDCRFAINSEIEYLKVTGGKKYRIIDGEKLPSKNGEYLYAFDTDTEMHYPDGTAIKLWFPDNIVTAYVVSCEDFTILIRTMEYIGEFVESVEFTSEQWQLLESLMDRLDEMEPRSDAIAYEVACNGRRQISQWNSIRSGQNYAFNRATTEKITFIWGPPGTGKTETLSNIAMEHILKGRRVLMLSYSNVSVDGALLRVAKKADLPDGMVDLQYRMHLEIADFVSENMYQGRLKTFNKIMESRNEIAALSPCRNEAMTLMDLSGMYSICTKTKDNSRINLLSAMMSMRLAEKYIGNYEVGIVTPYSAQSRLIVAMLRDIQAIDKRWEKVSCATVHQFQGSEKPVIIYDAVDCYRMPYPGTLLTSLKNDTANRLFNVAVTRAKGKFILIANVDYLLKKKISKNLIFTKAINMMRQSNKLEKGFEILDELMPELNEKPSIYLEDRETSWETFISDIEAAKKIIHIDMPDIMDDSDGRISQLSKILNEQYEKNVEICIRHSEEIDLPNDLQKFQKIFEYVTTPVTIIDKSIIWFGQPLYAADFISEGEILDTEYFPCMRFEGKYSARLLQAFLEM